jgi:hypothetical protein
MRTVWSSISAGLPLPPDTLAVVDARLRDLPLAKAS